MLKNIIFFFFIFLAFFSKAISAVGEGAYTTSGNQVAVIDVALNSVVASISVGNSPIGIVFTPDFSNAYVVNSGSSSVSVIDTATLSVIETITDFDGDQIQYLAILPDGSKIYVTNLDSNFLFVIDTATNTVTTTIAVGAFTTKLAASPDSAKIYVNSGFIIYVIDTATDTVSATINTQIQDVAFSPDGTKAYATLPPFLKIIDTATDAQIATVNFGGTGSNSSVDFAPDGSVAYITTQPEEALFIIDVATDTVTGSISVGNPPTDIAFSTDSSIAYISGNFISVIDVAGSTVSTTIALSSSQIVMGQVELPIPTNITASGYCKKNIFFSDTDYINRISWDPFPSGGIKYIIYRNASLTEKAGETSISTTVFNDHNRIPGQNYTYYITVVTSGGSQTLIATTTVQTR